MTRNNVGGTDRMIRVIIGLLFLISTATGKIGAWGWIGFLPLATGLFKFCPAYGILGMNTCTIRPALHEDGRTTEDDSEKEV